MNKHLKESWPLSPGTEYSSILSELCLSGTEWVKISVITYVIWFLVGITAALMEKSGFLSAFFISG